MGRDVTCQDVLDNAALVVFVLVWLVNACGLALDFFLWDNDFMTITVISRTYRWIAFAVVSWQLVGVASILYHFLYE